MFSMVVILGVMGLGWVISQLILWPIEQKWHLKPVMRYCATVLLMVSSGLVMMSWILVRG
jgi:hypothetical protein